MPLSDHPSASAAFSAGRTLTALKPDIIVRDHCDHSGRGLLKAAESGFEPGVEVVGQLGCLGFLRCAGPEVDGCRVDPARRVVVDFADLVASGTEVLSRAICESLDLAVVVNADTDPVVLFAVAGLVRLPRTRSIRTRLVVAGFVAPGLSILGLPITRLVRTGLVLAGLAGL